MNNVAAYVGITIINELKEMSKKHDFLIIVIEGTKEHDANQLKYFTIDDDKYPNVRVIKNMSIEYLEKYDKHVLCIPDDLTYPNAQSEAIRKIKELGLEKVDICALHGFCKHEIPPHIPIKPYNLFDSDVLMKYVKGPIIKGHVHTSSIYKTTLNNGSFERNRHGEEERKGFFYIKINTDGTFTYEFIVNENTMIFKEISLPEHNTVEVFKKKMEKILTNKRDHRIHINIVCSRATKIKFNPADYPFDHPIFYKFKLLDDEFTSSIEQDEFITPIEELVKINKSNLSTLLADRMQGMLSSSRIEEIFITEDPKWLL